MRNLTILRKETFAGCTAKLIVYIETDFDAELTVNNVPCRKLGTLKANTPETFLIDEKARKLFVIADKLSKDYCFDCYQLPEGTEDVSLSGKCNYNPATGNAFVFDNNNSKEAIEQRKKNAGKGLTALLIGLFVGVLIGLAVAKILLLNK